jgi:hypothetical protein
MSRLFVLNGGAAVKPDLRGAMLNIEDPKSFFQKAGINTGDVLVYDATLKQLAYDNISNIQFSHAADEKLWPNEEPDATIVRGSNYLTSDLDLGHVIPLLKKLKGPIVPIGVGAQAATYSKLKIPKGSAEAWRIIASKCENIAVRGFYSAEVFNDLGIKNVRIIGCPSFYRSLQPAIKLRKLDCNKLRIGLTLNKYLSANYASSTIKTNRMQRALLEAVANRRGSRFYSQGEREESLAVVSQGDEKRAMIDQILKTFTLHEEPAVVDLLMNRMSAHFDVDTWAEDVGTNVDCMMGFRLHGNVIALHQGIPAVFFTYDSRIRELASLFQVPALDIDDFVPIDLDQIVENANFSKFETAYQVNYREYLQFLNENKLSHRMPQSHATQEVVASIVNRVQLNFTPEEMYRWMLQEVGHLADSNETLRKRAWGLELRLREMRAQKAEQDGAQATAA